MRNNITAIDYRVLIQLKACYQERRLTRQQYKTIRGQALAGDGEAAMKGLRTILLRKVDKADG